jgi:hypothetical protein
LPPGKKSIFESFLANRNPFDREFAPPLAHDFYVGVRCGVFHEARTNNGWMILAESETGQIIDPNLKIVYRDSCQTALLKFVRWYKTALPSSPTLLEAFLRKFDNLCVR